jgi:hypothetical protein
MILEGLVTTVDESGAMHLAPMGPIVDRPDFQSLRFRPYETSQTGGHLRRTKQGVFHLSDNVELFARSAIGLPVATSSTPAESVTGFVLVSCVRAFEFEVDSIDTSRERHELTARVVKVHHRAEWIGFNRAKHAVLEAAILATRFHLLPADEIDREFDRLRTIVGKTAGPTEEHAFALLDDARRRR